MILIGVRITQNNIMVNAYQLNIWVELPSTCIDVRMAMNFMRHHLHIYTRNHGAMSAVTEIQPIL